MRENEGMNDQSVPGSSYEQPTQLPAEPPVEAVPPERQTWLDKIASWFDSIGVSPKVGAMFVTGLVIVAAHWIETGEFNEEELRLLLANFLLGVVGVTLPPAAGYRQAPLSDHKAKRRAR